MKTLYITRGNNIVIDTETNTVDRLLCARTAIDDLFRVKEAMHVVYQRGEYKREFDVEPGDLVITFYDSEFLHQVVVVRNSDWSDTIDAYEKAEQKRKEEWAAKHNNLSDGLNKLPDTCGDCENSCGGPF